MRISELATATGVPVPTLKFYLREGLMPEGARTSATQAAYDEGHVQRVRVIRALVTAGVSIAETRRVVGALDAPPPRTYDLLGIAHAAVSPASSPEDDTADAVVLYERLGGDPAACDPALVGGIARALAGLDAAGFSVPPAVLDAYVSSARTIAEAEIAGIPVDSAAESVRYIVLGTVLTEPLILALRRAAQQIVSGARFGAG